MKNKIKNTKVKRIMNLEEKLKMNEGKRLIEGCFLLDDEKDEDDYEFLYEDNNHNIYVNRNRYIE